MGGSAGVGILFVASIESQLLGVISVGALAIFTGRCPPEGEKRVHANVRIDHQLLAVEAEHDVHVMLELPAPQAPPAQRPPLNLALVLDRSGSMGGSKLEYALQATDWLLSRPHDADRVALVNFDDEGR